MPKIKKGIKVETIVDFIDPDVEFVSLVGHAANREPFVILKSEGGSSMSKVIVSVLVPKSLSEDKIADTLKEYNTGDATEYDTYTKYQQVALEEVQEDTIQLIYLGKGTKVMAVTAVLKEADPEDDSTKEDDSDDSTEKDAVEYATLDSVLTEAYAFMDIMIGSLQQSGMTKENRKEVIIGALKNFQTFLEVSFDTMDEKELTKCLEIKKDDEADPEADAEPEADPAPDAEPVRDINKPPEGKPADQIKSITEDTVAEMIAKAIEAIETPAEIQTTRTVLDDFIKTTEGLQTTTDASLKEVTDTISELRVDVDGLKVQPKTISAFKAEDTCISAMREDTPKDVSFTGTLFK